jgi:hypothetical protein
MTSWSQGNNFTIDTKVFLLKFYFTSSYYRLIVNMKVERQYKAPSALHLVVCRIKLGISAIWCGVKV